MALSKVELSAWRRAKAAGAGAMATSLTDPMCGYLLARIIRDLGQEHRFPNLPGHVPDFYTSEMTRLAVPMPDAISVFEQVVHDVPDSLTYFLCLVSLLKSRLKYANILSGQPFPTFDQVGPRSLLQYGTMTPRALATLLFWRKWFFDIDNRAGQETGYLFEPVIAAAVGGVPITASKSPVKSHRDGGGRQVDCLLDQDAYEIKIRVTIAASGQGRWREELDFAIDCKSSGYRPVLVVLDGTPNPKLKDLTAAFVAAGGVSYVGPAAWSHLEALAGSTMARFLERYVRAPLSNMLAEAPGLPLPELTIRDEGDHILLKVNGEDIRVDRHPVVNDERGDPAAG